MRRRRRRTGSTNWPATRGETWLPRYGGFISSEWEFAKGLELLEGDPEIYQRMSHWVEAADWIVWQLGGQYVRNACTAGYKGILQDGHYPSADFLAALNPDFAGFVTDKLEHEIGQLGRVAGHLTEQAAEWTGLPVGIAVAVGNVDAHVVRTGRRVDRPRTAGRDHGHVNLPRDERHRTARGARDVRGGAGRDHRGTLGLRGRPERSRRHLRLVRPHRGARSVRAARSSAGCHRPRVPHRACRRASRLVRTGCSRWTGTAATARSWSTTNSPEWLSGRHSRPSPRTPTERCSRRPRSAPEPSSTAFVDSGIPVTELVVVGGLMKNALLMQIYADVTGLPLSLAASSQGAALGSAIHAAVAAGAYPDVPAAAAGDGQPRRQRVPADPGERCRLRRDVRRVPAAARLLRPRREPGDAEPEAAQAVCCAAQGAGMRLSNETKQSIARLRDEVSALHAELIRWNLVVWTAGNVSARVPGADLLVIKPSGVDYRELTPRSMVVTDFDGVVVEGDAAPSSDTFAAGYVYAHLDRVGGSCTPTPRYATAFAARREPIPCVLTMMADEFGGDIPVGPFAMIGDDSIGRGIVDTLRTSPVQRRADGQPRPVHHRPHRPGCGQDRRDVRRGRPHGALARQHGTPHALIDRRHRLAVRTATRTVYGQTLSAEGRSTP